MKRILLLLTLTFACFRLDAAALVDGAGKKVRYAGRFSASPVEMPADDAPRRRHLRGVWVATVENLDWDVCKSPEEFKKQYTTLLNELAKRKFNAVFFQIRPSCDAFYPSRYNVYSRSLAGAEGRGLGSFDPLRFMVYETRKRGMEFHAWLNPYRVTGKTKLSKTAYLNTLDPRNFARRNPHLVLAFTASSGQNSLFLDPGAPEVVEHLVNTVSEIAEKYPVNAIHFDDYFYPYEKLPDGIDKASYLRYNPKRLGPGDWRRSNVDTLVLRCSGAIRAAAKKQKRRIEFGISPFGIWANVKSTPLGSLTGGKESYFVQYADTRKWVKNGYVDYVVPQLYWGFSHDTAAYAALCDWWASAVKGTRVKLYTGHAFYRVGDGFPAGEVVDQLRYDRKHADIAGAVFFRYRFLVKPTNRVMREECARLSGYWKNL